MCALWLTPALGRIHIYLLLSVMLCNSVVVSSFFSNSCRWRILILISSIMSTASAVTMGKLSGKVALITGCFRVHKRMNIQ